jgi:precorrin-6B methylase 1
MDRKCGWVDIRRTPVRGRVDGWDSSAERAGRLVIVGSGITAIAHLTPETIGHIRSAEIVFYHANSGVVATQILELNPNAVDLYEYYGEGKVRSVTYVQMAELMLREVRRGRYVVGLFHGHPGFFVHSGRRALAIAKMEGYPTQLLPAISTLDCLFADLRVDPGVFGVQMMKASHVLRKDVLLATGNHLILIQISSVGDNTFSFTGYKNSKLDKLFGKLISVYGEQHDSIYYVAPIFPSFDPIIKLRKLGEYRDHQVSDTVSASTLYLPPAGISFESLTALQSFRDGEAYTDFEMAAIADLDTYAVPAEYKKRGASLSMLRVIEDLASTPEAVSRYLFSPEGFVGGYAGLDADERRALLTRTLAEMRQATTDKYESNLGAASPILGQARIEVLDSAPSKPPVKLSMKWTPAKQVISFGNSEFYHDGPITTDPSHDLAHLIIAANGNLYWSPQGDRETLKLAEYNAVFLEHLLNNIYNCVVSQKQSELDAFSQTLAHARWFVEKHFAPFPLSPEEAYCQFCRHIDPEMIVGLSPYFFEQKRAERNNSDYKRMSWMLTIYSNDRPSPAEQSGFEFSFAVKRQIMRLKGITS